MCWSCLCYFPIAASASSWQTPNRLCCPVLTLRAAAEQSAPPTRPKAAKSGFWPCAAILSRYCRWRKGEESRVLGFARLCAVFLQLCKGRCGKVRRIRVPAARLHTGRGSLEARRRRGSFRSGKERVAGPCRKRASGRSLPTRRGWGPLRSDGDGGSRLGGTSSSALNWPEAPQTYRLFGAACLHPGVLGGNCFRMEIPTFGMSPCGRGGHSFPAENRSCFCRQQFLRGGGAAFAFRRKIDIILISPRFTGPKRRSRRRASNVVGVAPECSRRRTLDRRGKCLPTTIRKRILANPRNRVNL